MLILILRVYKIVPGVNFRFIQMAKNIGNVQTPMEQAKNGALPQPILTIPLYLMPGNFVVQTVRMFH